MTEVLNCCENCLNELTCGYSPLATMEKRTEISKWPCVIGMKSNGKPFFEEKKMKSVTVYAHRSNETEKDCTVKFTRAAYYDVGKQESGKVKATVSTNKAGQGFGSPITLRFKASESCAKHYTMRDFCDIAASVIEEKLG